MNGISVVVRVSCFLMVDVGYARSLTERCKKMTPPGVHAAWLRAYAQHSELFSERFWNKDGRARPPGRLRENPLQNTIRGKRQVFFTMEMGKQNDLQDGFRKYWIDNIRDTGGITDCPRDISDAFKAAKSVCCSEVEKRGLHMNPVINWAADFVAAFMVSCVKNEEANIWDIMVHRDDFDEVFKSEAARNDGMIYDILFKAGQAHPSMLKTGLTAIVSDLRVAPTGSGKGVSNIRRLF